MRPVAAQYKEQGNLILGQESMDFRHVESAPAGPQEGTAVMVDRINDLRRQYDRWVFIVIKSMPTTLEAVHTINIMVLMMQR
jgi:hypothetical protein